ncbi:glycosyl hydrolase family 3 N terminal domain-containing protein [Microdochium trichocladiopsis]|uniref:beta-glucosidase n=1 Tax=Microdochium trichocladiopsis TaxID=1682393 RepID=A0A9P9BJX5_9PEZI|nr:glycosyl hydrolase family 3 N terminal domain-containing protein [Microdochium trichocladiopsis]KAH7018588.1 glycosyl hydrolase family 3 N terminal domain-containing protein [Microdochium trichocladiopsis]
MGSVPHSSAGLDARAQPLSVLAGLVGGHDFWHTFEQPELGLGSIRFSDGPNGVRGEDWVNGAPSAAIPCATALGASFDRDLVRRVAELLANECRHKGVHALLAPTMNIHRYVLCGRNFESFSEDPYLTGALATEYVKGLQRHGIAATPKHFLANEAENGRRWTNSAIEQSALREIYLEPFRMVVQDAEPWAVMTAYNSVNGSFCSDSATLLSVLRNDWCYKGAVVSDWFGTYTTAPALTAGLDLEMPGPSKFRTTEKLHEAITHGEVTREQIEQSANRIIGLLTKTGRIGAPGVPPPRPRTRETPPLNNADERLLVEAAEASMVLLKNEGSTLPISTVSGLRLSVFGELASQPSFFGGGSASLKVPATTPTPWESLSKRFPGAVLSPGVATSRLVKTPNSSGDLPIDGLVRLDWYNGSVPTAEQHFLCQEVKDTVYMLVEDVPDGLIDISDFCTTMTFSIRPSESGQYDISVCGPGNSTCHVNGELVFEVSRNLEVSTEDFLFDRSKLEARRPQPLTLRNDTTYEFRVTSWSSKHRAEHVNREFFIQGCRLGLELVRDDEAALAQSRQVAASTDVAVVVVGTGPEWESEGFDRVSMALPRRQAELVTTVAGACPGRTVVVVNAGSPVSIGDWVEHVDAVLYAWFPGAGFAQALTNMLSGDACPSARLPTTFWDSVEDYPAGHVESLMQKGCNDIVYREGVHVGYRAYGQVHPGCPSSSVATPRFAFGYGLSYSFFRYSIPALPSCQISGVQLLTDEPMVTVQLDVENTGTRPGRETVLFFVTRVENALEQRPEVQLKAFAKTAYLEVGQCERVTLELSRRSFSYWDVEAGAWRVDAGTYNLAFAGPHGVGDWRPTGREKISVTVAKGFTFLDA